MGIFDLFRGRRKEEPPKAEAAPQEEPLVYSHMRVEVTAFDGRLLFVAKLMNYHGTTAELHQYSEAEIPESGEGEEPLHVRIRGYHDRQRKAIYMEGLITPTDKHIWLVKDLTISRVGNDRAFFRLDMEVDATATTFGGAGAGERPCKLVNISVGGACIASEHRYWEGDKFLLNVRLLEDRDPSIMFCQVLRIVEKGEGKFEYGCRFLELNEADEGKITQNIFAAQRRRRNGAR